MKCENCLNDHIGNYASGRFCSKKCSRGFSTKNKRKEINEKVSLKLKNIPKSEEHKNHLKNLWKSGYFKNRKSRQKFWKFESLFEENPKIKNTSIIKNLLFSNGTKYECNVCKINSWNNSNIILELHHKNGNNKDNNYYNLEILCPNCHSQTENYAGRNRNKAFIPVQASIL